MSKNLVFALPNAVGAKIATILGARAKVKE